MKAPRSAIPASLAVLATLTLQACSEDEPDFASLCRDSVRQTQPDGHFGQPSIERADGVVTVTYSITGRESRQASCAIVAESGEVLHTRITSG